MRRHSAHQQSDITRAVFLTAQPIVLTELCTYLIDQSEKTHEEGTVYQVGTFTNPRGDWQVAVAETGAGNNNTAMETERAIRQFEPSVTIYIGLAGGLKDVGVGDVVASTKIYGYESGKDTAEAFEIRPNVGQGSYGLEQRARAEARKGDWRKRLGVDVRATTPRAIVGPIAAGERNISAGNSQIVAFIKANYGDTLAVEMEGRGFLEAVRANQRVEAIIIRGISNLLDNKGEAEAGGSQSLAAKHACAFAFELLSKLHNSSAADKPRKSVATQGQKRPLRKIVEAPIPARDVVSAKESPQDDGLKVTTIENLYSVLTGHPSPILFLGGGASVKSGIPLSEGLVEKAARWEHCRSKGLAFDDPSVKRSDWLQSLRRNSWYDHASLAANYSSVMKHLLSPRDNRREFFLQILHTNVPASSGYERLVELMSLKVATTVLTTNFDPVLRDLSRSRPRLHNVDVIDSPANYRQLTTSPRYPILAHLYGSLESYIDRFESAHEPQLDATLINRLVPILRDHPLIVIGYEGAEEAVMRGLFMSQIEAADYYHQGIYWCTLNNGNNGDLHPMVREFAGLIRGNFQIVPIEGFDELMGQISAMQQRHGRASVSIPSPQIQTPPTAPTFDMHSIGADLNEELDWTSLSSRLVNYCNVMEIAVPATVNREWLVWQLCQLDLAVKNEKGKVLPTNAGYLLFGRDSHERIPSSKVRLRVEGEEQEIKGNLWNQLATLTDALAEVNKPFRLKGDKSETVYPYPALALKEMLVNALVHRRYDVKQNVVVEIESDHIRITNPGGLVEEVLRQTEGASILDQIAQGKRGIKGYRNPVLADLFYSSGDMDKEGSGLADVHKLVNDNGGRVTFDPINDNSAFEAIIYSRPEAVDKQTGTAARVVSTRYAANLLEVMGLPDKVWQAPSPYSRIKDVWATTNAKWLPPFIPHEQKLNTFFNLEDESNPLRELVDVEEARWVTLDQFCSDQDGHRSDDATRKLVYLLNECLYRHLDHCGLYVDKKRKRAYFPRTKQGNRSITYQARLRRSTRTVTKQIISPSTQKVRYWEHQSFSFMFERFADTWALQILPGYVFTRDGFRDLLSGERVNVLSTKRASRDYNYKVHTDLFFWAGVMSGGDQGIFTLLMGPKLEEQKGTDGRKVTKTRQQRRKKTTGHKYKSEIESPQILIKTALPTLVTYNLEAVDEEEEGLMEEQHRAELEDLEDELEVLAGAEEDFEYEVED
ncbi:MAG: hypothetical protein LC803_21180 [Acidobacteria bacterium]|nr:hypothetical protein [Acidobacteriota bacterium]